jgi:hypothetical protein
MDGMVYYETQLIQYSQLATYSLTTNFETVLIFPVVCSHFVDYLMTLCARLNDT